MTSPIEKRLLGILVLIAFVFISPNLYSGTALVTGSASVSGNFKPDCANASGSPYVSFSLAGQSTNTTLVGCCGTHDPGASALFRNIEIQSGASYNGSISLDGEICTAGMSFGGLPACWSTKTSNTGLAGRPSSISFTIQVFENTNTPPGAAWAIKDESGAPQDSTSQSGHYRMFPGCTATATPLNVSGSVTFTIVGDSLGCVLSNSSGNYVLVLPSNIETNGTVHVQEQLLVGDPCTGSTDFYFDLEPCQGGCSGSGSCPRPPENNSVDVKWSLGPSFYSGNSAFLQVKSVDPSPILGSPESLRCDFIRIDLDKITNSAGWLRQVRASDRAVDILTNSSTSYSLLFYSITNVGPQSNGLYTFNGSPFQTVTIQLVGGDTNHVQILDSLSATPVDYFWGGNGWTLTTGNGLRNESKTVTQSGSIRTETRTINNALSVVESYSLEKWQTFDFGERLVEQVVGSAHPKTNTFSYGDNGLLSQVTRSDGSWEIYQYDSLNRQTARFIPFTNCAPTTNASVTHVFYSSYDTNLVSGSGDDGSFEPYTPRRVIESVLGTEVSRRYTSLQYGKRIDVQCVNPGVAWDDTSNLFTTNFLRTDTPFLNQPAQTINPDGTMRLFSYIGVPLTQKTVKSGAPNSTFTSITNGTQEDSWYDSFGRVTTNTVKDIVSGIIIANTRYAYDSLGRLTNTVYLDGTQASQSYDCCNVFSSTDRDGSVTSYIYDDLKRQVATIRAGIVTSNVLDSTGNVLATVRYGMDGSAITISQASYNDGGEQTSSIDALNNTTTYTNYFDSDGQLIRVTIYADSSTSIETYANDGSRMKVSGTAVHGVRYEYGVESDGGVARRYTKEIKLDANGSDTSEWTKTYVDGAARAYKVVYAAASGAPFTQSLYNNKGQLSKQVDPDGVTTLYQYNTKGELEYTALDLNTNGVIDFVGTDRISRSVTTYIASGSTNLAHTENGVWSTNSSAVSNLVSVTDASVDGLHTWQIGYRDATTKVTNRQDIVYSGNGIRTVTATAPDKSFTITQYEYDKPTSVTSKDAASNQLAKVTFKYDVHGRTSQSIDVRNGATTYTYNNGDMTATVTTPAPNGQRAQTTVTTYNNRLQIATATAPDGATKSFQYYPTGELKQTSGGREYPVAYSYDYAGRMATMTNWSSFNTGAGARVTTWSYDPYRGWMTDKTYDGGVTGPHYTYTSGGRFSTRQWARIGTAGQRILTSYTYGFNGSAANNAHGDLVSTTYSYDPQNTPGVTNTYDRLGRIATIAKEGMTTGFAYNTANQVLAETNQGGFFDGWGTTNVYDSLLRRTALQVISNNNAVVTVNYGYDAASRLQSVTNANYNASYSYIPNSPLIGQVTFRSNSLTQMTTTKVYDNLNRLTSISSLNSQQTTLSSFNYTYNDANQRVRVNQVDGTFWLYEYDNLGQVRSGKRYWSDSTPVAGQQFEYAFDDIGNRRSTKAGGDEHGANLRTATYSANTLNQYTNRTVPGAEDIIGLASAPATVTVNDQSTYRRGEYYRKELAIDNSTAPVWQSITNQAVQGTTANSVTGNLFVPQTPETFTYDADGNLTSDGRWTNQWDAENRLVSMTSLSNVSTDSWYKLDFSYDYLGRRVQKIVSNWQTAGYVSISTNRFKYDGWNLAVVLDGNNALLDSFTWGIDMSGSQQGAGGVGGLLSMTVYRTNAGTYFYIYDGNGNARALVNAANGTLAAQYEYEPFGELVGANGGIAKMNPFRFSTKYEDDETDVLYYGYRFYNANTGRWLSRDRIEEIGGINLYAFVVNQPIDRIDLWGFLWYEDLANWANRTIPATQDALAGELGYISIPINNTLSGLNLAAQTPNAIGTLGAGTGTTGWYIDEPILQPIVTVGSGLGTWWTNPSWENATGAAEDVSTIFSVLAAGLKPVPAIKMSRCPAKIKIKLRIRRALEPQRTGPAPDFENSLPGAASDVASRMRIVPALEFDNPNPNGYDFVKFDGQDLKDASILIDRKFNSTTKSKQVADVQRVAEALRQNPSTSLIIEVPSEASRRAIIRTLTKAGHGSNPQITVRIAQ